MLNFKNIKKYFIVLFFVTGINNINGKLGESCTGTPDCGNTKEQCYHNICTIRCSSESDCAGLPGKNIACSQGYCQI